MDEMMRDALRALVGQIDTAMNSEDEIDRTYLLEAVQEDLRRLANGYTIWKTQDLIDNPIS